MTSKSIYTDKLLRREIWLKAKTESGLELGDDDINMCILTMERKGVSYFHDHIWANKRWDKNTRANKIVWTLSADGRRAIAHQQGLAGMDPIEFEEDAEGMPKVARVRVYRNNASGGRDEYWGEARWLEYVEKKRDGDIQQQWQRRPFAQLGKCAEMQALRRAFPEMDLEGSADAVDEVWSGDAVPEETKKEMAVESKESAKPVPEPPKPKLVPEPEPEPEVSGSPEHKAQVKKVLEETEKRQLDGIKGEALILFKAWADRFNGGKSMAWKAVYRELTGVIVDNETEMDAGDYTVLISSFREKLEEKVETNG